MNKERELLMKLANWLDPMHLQAPSYQDCCEAYELIIEMLNSQNHD